MTIEAALRGSRIREVKPERAVIVDGRATLAETLTLMREERSACALICDDGKLHAIFTERDLLNKITGEEIPPGSAVREFATPNPNTVTSDKSLWDALGVMQAGSHRHVPIVDDSNVPEGVISIRHIIEVLAELFPAEVLNLPPRTNQFMNSREGG